MDFLGREVLHPQHGQGTVRAVLHGGLYLQVDFGNGNLRWIHLKDASFPKPKPQPRTDQPKRDKSPAQHRAFKYRQIVEAFRFGLTPQEHIDDTLFGRQVEQQAIRTWTTKLDYPILTIIGEYGAGKTHLLRWTYQQALRSGWAVAFAQVDPLELPFHRPKRLYRWLAHSLSFLDPQSGKTEGYRQLIKRGLDTGVLKEHLYFRELCSPDSSKWEWIEARTWPRLDTTSYALYDYGTTANIYCYLLSGLAVTACAIGLRGLCLLFDEAEGYRLYDYGYQYDQTLNTIRALVRLAFNDKALLGDPATSGLDYCRMGMASRIPFAYREQYKMKIAFALTEEMLPLEWELCDYGSIPKECNLKLAPLTQEDFRNIFARIQQFYERAYNYSLDGISPDAIFRVLNEKGGFPRRFIKACVELFDLIRFDIGIP